MITLITVWEVVIWLCPWQLSPLGFLTGNCWFIAAAAVLATKKELFAKVVPTDQGFDANYCGESSVYNYVELHNIFEMKPI